jgi:uncharacterized protein YvpB
MNQEQILSQAASAVQAGHLPEARRLIRQAVEGDPSSFTAWALLLETAQNDQQKRFCLQKMLHLNPSHAASRQAWAQLTGSDWEKPARKIPVAWVLFVLLMLLVALAGVVFGKNLSTWFQPLRNDALSFVPEQVTPASVVVPTETTINTPPTPYQPEPPTATPSATNTQTPSPTLTATLSPSPTQTATITPTRTPKPVRTRTQTPLPTPTVPESASVDIYGHQRLYNLDCETGAAVDWANYFGVKISEDEFFSHLPLSDNPEIGFVGSVYGEWGQIPPYPYGIHAKPVAALLREYGLNAKAVRYFPYDSLQREIAAGRPVIVWVVGQVEPGKGVYYQAQDGSQVLVARFEHTIIATGYSADEVYFIDGKNRFTRDLFEFLKSWSVLGYMGIILEP